MSDCGCRPWVAPGDELHHYHIEFCNLHARAGELREALMEASDILSSQTMAGHGPVYEKETRQYSKLIAKTKPGEEKL